MVLKNGIEVKLQRNVLSVLESPTGDEVDDEFDLSSASCDLRVKDHDLGCIELPKVSTLRRRPRVRHRKLLDPSGRANTNNGNCFKEFPTKIHLPPSQFEQLADVSELTSTYYRKIVGYSRNEPAFEGQAVDVKELVSTDYPKSIEELKVESAFEEQLGC